MKIYTISPSELSYVCDHCAYIGKNFNLYPKMISAGVTQTLDSMEKEFFLGDVKKIDKNIKEGETIDPFNISFFSKVLKDDKNRPFRIKGKGDAIIKFEDGTSGIIDYKTSKFKEKNGKDFSKDLEKKINEYEPQLHGYSLLYSNLETDEKFLAEHSRAKKPDSIKKSVEETLKKIKKITINKTSLLGLVFIYPEELKNTDNISIDFSFKFTEVKYDIKNFMKILTKYLDILHDNKPPEPNETCETCNYFVSAGRMANEK